MQQQTLQKEIQLLDHWPALAQLAQACELSRAEVSEAASKGALWRRKPGKKAKLKRIRDTAESEPGDTLVLNYNRDVLDQQPLLPTLVTDHGNYSIWYKPSGVLSQGSKWSDHCTITETAAAVSGKKCLLVHRLDRAARGLIVLAHTSNACKALASLFALRKVKKIYQATVHGEFDLSMPATIDALIDDKSAITVVLSSVYEKDSLTSALQVEIKTGRKHQIRNHLASIGFPVVGDRLFDPARSHESDLQLVASELQFNCPFNGELHTVALPGSLLNAEDAVSSRKQPITQPETQPASDDVNAVPDENKSV